MRYLLSLLLAALGLCIAWPVIGQPEPTRQHMTNALAGRVFTNSFKYSIDPEEIRRLSPIQIRPTSRPLVISSTDSNGTTYAIFYTVPNPKQ